MPTDNKRTGTPATNTEEIMKPKKTWSTKKKVLVWGGGALTAAFTLAAPLVIEAEFSPVQEYLGTNVAHNKTGPGFSAKKVTTPPEARSAIDKTRGYADNLKEDAILRKQNFTVSPQKEHYERKILGTPLFSLEEPKAQAGLSIIDDSGETIYQAKYPRQIFNSFDEIPVIWWQTLLEVENRELLNHQDDKIDLIVADIAYNKNVTIEIDRLAKAIFLHVAKKAGLNVSTPGGSGLPVQIEKMLHSPNGQSHGDSDEKKRQILTAMAKYYKDLDAKKFVVTYFNTVSLASTKWDGNVDGYAEAMHIWYGRDLDQVKTMLNTPDDKLDAEGLKLKAQIYMEAASLVIAVKKPDEYYNGPAVRGAHLSKAERAELGRKEMRERLGLLLHSFVTKGIISQKLFDQIDLNNLKIADPNVRHEVEAPSPYKYVNNLRIKTQQTMKVPSLYDLDRRDLTARSTLLGSLNRAAEEVCNDIHDPAFARANGLVGGPEGRFNFDERDLPYVKCAVIINEQLPDGRNVNRVLTDNVKNSPMNQVSGGRQGMGSTSKFRWGLAVYELTMGELYDKYSTKTPEELNARLKEISVNDNLTRWALTTLADPKNAGMTFETFLDAALERTYSGNPGGTEVQNFDSEENSWNKSVRINFHFSVNAAFIRIMRDNVSYVIYEKMGIDPKMFDDMSHPARDAYLDDFTKQEGAIFLYRAYVEQQDMSPAAVEKLLIAKTKFRSPSQMAALFRYLHPEKSVWEMSEFVIANADAKQVSNFLSKGLDKKTNASIRDLQGRYPKSHVAIQDFITGSSDPIMADGAVEDIALSLTISMGKNMDSLYKEFAPGAYDQAAHQRVNKKTGEVKKYSAVYDLNERSYKLKVHPMALWLAKYRTDHPDAKFADVSKAAAVADAHNGKSAYRQSYDWLFKPSKAAAQKRSLISIVRHKAFNDYLGPQQQTLGYPFAKVVDSEKIVLGSNGDTPDALATLLGVVQGDGVLRKADSFSVIARGEGTEFEKIATKHADQGKVVMRPEIAKSLREELQGVVQEGTGKKLREAFKLPAYDADGKVIPNTYRLIPNGGKTGSDDGKLKSGGKVIGAKSRTATWTFIIGNRLSGTVFLYIDGQAVAPIPGNQSPAQPATQARTASQREAQAKISNPALRAHFTSATAVITTRILFARPEFQQFVAREFYGNKVDGETVVVDKPKPEPKPAKPVTAPKIAANDHHAPAIKPEKQAIVPN
jgi:membrane peptidoglycan carboxypeptidase